jgi:drug/metabolite transporter (DMT)-like permease
MAGEEPSMIASQTRQPDRLTLIAFGGVVLFGGLNTIAVRQSVLELEPLWNAAARFLLAGLVMIVLTRLLGRRLPRGRSLLGAVAYGAVGFAGAFGLIYPGLRDVPAGTGGVVLALSPLATYGLAVAQHQEAFRARALAGAAVAMAGVAIVFVDQLGADVPLGSLALVVGGTLCLSEAGIIVKWIPRADPFGINSVAMLTAGGLLLAASRIIGEPAALPATAGTWLAFAYLVVFGSVVMFGLYVVGVMRWTASRMAYTTLLLPFVSVSLASILTGETISIAFVIGGMVMLAGVYLGAFAPSRPNRSTATSLPECLPIEDCAAAPTAALQPAD